MEDKKVRQKKRVSGKGRIALIVAVPLVVGLFLSFAISSLGSYEQQTTEVVAHKSPLVWRTDAEGDYLLSELSSGGTYELVEAVETEGEIETLSATWEFKGEVTLEVSADNGLNYTPVVYGVPLSSGFVSGNQIKWRVTIAEDSELTEIKIAYTDTSGAMGTFGRPELSGFKYRKPVYITNRSGEELFNYQMVIKVAEKDTAGSYDLHCEGNIEADFEDIRFTSQDGETLLPYYLENITGQSPDRIARFWVKIPQIPAQGLTVYIYYGNSEAEGLSSTQEVFDLFEDFDKDKLNPATWEMEIYLGGDYQLKDSLLKLDAAKLISKKYQIRDGIIEYRAKAEATGGELRAIIKEDKDDPNLTQLVYSSTYPGAEHSIAIGNIVKANAANPIVLGVFYDYRVIAKGQEITFERYEIASPAFGGLAMTEALLKASVSYEDTGGLTKGYLGFETGGVGNGDRVAYYDWLRVRKFAESEPYIDSSGNEQEVNLAEFVDTVVADDGDVVLDSTDGTYLLSGRYIPPALSTACNISTITPSLRATEGSEAISIDISTDGGLTWKTSCISGRTYTAPLDFSVGKDLKLRARLSTVDINASPQLEQIKVDYSIAPIVSSTNIYYSGASGGEVYKLGDTVVVEWDNSSTGDNNPDITSVSSNFTALAGESAAKMYDDGPLGGHGDKGAGDNIYTTQYELPEDLHTTTNIYITAGNKCGLTTRDGHILSVDTRAEAAEELIEAEEEEAEAKAKKKVKDLKKRFTIKFGADEAEIGDFDTEDFRPYAKMKRWGGECFLGVEIPDTHIPAADKAVEEKIGKKIEWDSPQLGGRFYKKPRRETTKKDIRGKSRRFVIDENGGLEFEIVLKQRPASNVISLPIKSKGLKFYYQGPLTKGEKNKGIVRPDEVMGSYAVYHESKKDGKYKTGKAFHIYRPKIIDKNGDWTWGELNIDGAQGVLTITIDQAWLNNAAYPVVVDPEFGYMSIGSSSIPIENIARGSVFMAELMRPNNITAYLENTDSGASHTAKYAIYKASDSTLVAQTVEVTVPASGKDWYEGLYISPPDLSAQDYALAARGNSGNILMYFDEGTPNQGVSQAINYTADWPEIASFSYDNNIYSIYDDVLTGTITITCSFSFAPLNITVTLDTNNPTAASITAPSADSYNKGTFDITATGADAGGIATIEFWNGLPATGTKLGDDTSDPYKYSWATTDANDGDHDLYARVIDGLDNYLDSSPGVTIYVDNTAPTAASIIAPSADSYNKGTFDITATGADAIGIAKIEFWDGVPDTGTKLGDDTSDPYSYSWATDAGDDGDHTLYARVIDNADNYLDSSSPGVTIHVDNTAPTAPTNALVVADGPEINAAEETAGFTIVVDLAGTSAVADDELELLDDGASFSSPITFTLTSAEINADSYTFNIAVGALGADGLKPITARVTDVAGNVGAEGAVYDLSLDTEVPAFTSVAVVGDEYYKAGDTVILDIDLGESGLTVTADLSVLDTDFSDSQLIDDDTDETYSYTTAALSETTMEEDVDIAVTIIAEDVAGNQTEDDTLTLTLDKTLPTAGITYSITHAVKNTDTLTITATFNEPIKDDPVMKIGITYTGEISPLVAIPMDKTDTTHYYHDLDVPLGNGVGTVTLSIGTDLAGNLITATPTSGPTFTVDNTLPDQPSIPAFVAHGAPVVANTLNESNTNFTASATITAGTATGGSAELLIGGASFDPVIEVTNITEAAESVEFDAGFTTNNQVKAAFASTANLSVTLTDEAGNAITGDNRRITVDYDKPTVTISTSPDSVKALEIGELTITLDFNETMDASSPVEPIVTYDPYGDGTGPQSCSGEWTDSNTYVVHNNSAITTATGDGTATISVTAARDVNGCTMTADTDDTFVIDTTPPEVEVTIDRGYYTTTVFDPSEPETWADADTIEGTYSDEPTEGIDVTAGIDNVKVSIKGVIGGTGHYWDGEDWDVTAEVAAWNDATTITGDWTYALDNVHLTPGKKYTVRAKAKDNAGNESVISDDSFVYVPILKITVGSLSGGSSSVSTVAGVPVQLTITATDDLCSDAVSSYGGASGENKTLMFSGPGNAPDPEETPATIGGANVGTTVSIEFTNGIGTAELLAYRADDEPVDVKDNDDAVINSSGDPSYDLDLEVTPATADALAWESVVLPQAKVVTGAPFSRFKINVTDEWGNLTSAGTPQVIIKLANDTETGLTGNSETTNAEGEAIFSDLIYDDTAGTIEIKGTSTAAGGIVTGTRNVIVEDNYNITLIVRDSVNRNQLPQVTLGIYGVATQGLEWGPDYSSEDIELPYEPAGYMFEFTKEGYVPSTETKIPSSVTDGSDNTYDNSISWIIDIMSIQEALADYKVISSFVYTEPGYDANGSLKPDTDTLNMRLWLERRGKLIVHQDVNKLQDASIEIYDESYTGPEGTQWLPAVKFIGVKYDDDPEVEAWYNPSGCALPDDYTGEENEYLQNGVYQKTIPHITTGELNVDGKIWDLTAGRTYFVRCKVTWGGSSELSLRTYVAGTTFTITISEKLQELARDILTGLGADLGIDATTGEIIITKTVTDKIEEEIVEKLGVTGEQGDHLAKRVADAISSIKGGEQGPTISALRDRLIEEHATRILNQASTVRLNDTMTIQYKAAEGLKPTPTIDLYDADNKRQIKGEKMEETESGSGIYEYEVKFAWGLGEHTIICQTEATLDGITMQVVSADLESIASDTTTTMAKLMDIDTDEISRLGMHVDRINTVIAGITGSMDELSEISDKVKELSQETTDAIYAQLEVATEKLKEINEGQGIKIEKMYDLSEEQSSDVDYIRNKTLEIKALVELSQEILSREGDEPIVKTWMETGETGGAE